MRCHGRIFHGFLIVAGELQLKKACSVYATIEEKFTNWIRERKKREKVTWCLKVPIVYFPIFGPASKAPG
jgi:hypothetical protein